MVTFLKVCTESMRVRTKHNGKRSGGVGLVASLETSQLTIWSMTIAPRVIWERRSDITIKL